MVEHVRALAAVWMTTSLFSLCAVSFTLYLMIRYPRLRGWPTTLVFVRALSQLMLIIITLYTQGAILHRHVTSAEDFVCHPFLTFLSNFFASLAICTIFGVALDVYTSLKSPFNQTRRKFTAFFSFIGTFSFVIAVLAATSHEYNPQYGICTYAHNELFDSNHKDKRDLLLIAAVLWFVFIAVSAAGVIWLVVFIRRHLSDARTQSAWATQIQGIRNSEQYSVSYVCLFAIYLLLGLISLSPDKDVDSAVNFLSALVIGLSGVWDLFIWARVYWYDIRREQKKANQKLSFVVEKKPQPQDISDSLRLEFVKSTSKGVSESSVLAETRAASIAAERKRAPLREGSALGGAGDEDVFVIIDKDIDLESETLKFKVSEWDFQVYRPRAFSSLRRIFGQGSAEYKASFDGDVEKMRALFSEGRSDSFFYFTPDRRFLVKTISRDEHDVLIEILDQYAQYMKANPDSLIIRVFGAYSIRMYGGLVYFAVFANVFEAPEGYKLHARYDLKGSTINRSTPPGAGSTLKDNDFRDSIMVEDQTAEAVLAQLDNDSKFLAGLNIMDYSLLLGEHHTRFVADFSKVNLRSRVTSKRGSFDAPTILEGDAKSSVHENPLSGRAADAKSRNAASASDTNTRDASGGVQSWSSARGSSGVGSAIGSLRVPEAERRPSLLPDLKTGAKQWPEPLDNRVVYASMIRGPAVYHIGIIDILQRWNWTKYAEQKAKVFLKLKTQRKLSCVEPVFYQDRFMRFMRERVFKCDQLGPSPRRGLGTRGLLRKLSVFDTLTGRGSLKQQSTTTVET